MNKTRIIGLTIIIIGIIIPFTLETNATDFISGIFTGLGIGFLFTGKFRKEKIKPFN